MSEVKKWLLEIGLPGLERLSKEFESRGFSTRKSLEYLEDGDLDYIFASPGEKLLLAEKRAITKELQRVRASSAINNLSNAGPRKQLDFKQSFDQQNQVPPAHFPEEPQPSTKTPLDNRAQELSESIRLLEVQVMSAEQHVQKLKAEENSLETASRGRICSLCHQVGHNRNRCRGTACESHLSCRLKDKHPELKKDISEGQKIVTSLKKNLNNARQELEQFQFQLTRARGNFFAIMRPRLKQIDPIKYLHRQALDKDLLILQRVLGKNIPPETDDWKLAHIIECYKRSCTPYYTLTSNEAGAAPTSQQQPTTSSLTASNSTSSTNEHATGQIPCIVQNLQITNNHQQNGSTHASNRVHRYWPY